MVDGLAFNGVSADSGEYLTPSMSADELLHDLAATESDADHSAELRWRVRRKEATLAPVEGVDPKDLGSCGWAIVLPHGADPEVREALTPLIEHRRRQAGERCRVLDYRRGETKQAFLSRHGAGPGPAVPDRVPYYLMLVGDPSDIPFRVQQQLDVQYAVGRLALDSPADYATYAQSVLTAENDRIPRPPRATFFATNDDPATELSAVDLIAPLAGAFEGFGSPHVVESVVGDLATKERLGKLLADAPSLLFTATHGVGFAPGSERQARGQGAVLCQDWPGPGTGPLSADWYFSGEDIDTSQDLTGMVMFAFSCYSAGTPEFDEYAHRKGDRARRIAPAPFVSALSRRLLANPGGAALAMIGHVDRAWGYSFSWPGVGRQTAVFESVLRRLVDGHPIGSAMEYINDRYAELASDLTVELEDIRYGKVPDALMVAAMWTANNDSRAFAILGDPAVVLPRSTGPSAPVKTSSETSGDVQTKRPDADSPADARTAILRSIESLGPVEISTSEQSSDGTTGTRAVARTRVTVAGSIDTVIFPGPSGDEATLRAHWSAVDTAVQARGELLRAIPALIEALDRLPPTSLPEGPRYG